MDRYPFPTGMFTFSAAEAAVIRTTFEDLDEMLAVT